jgi:beta-glucanase (GH16 family)
LNLNDWTFETGASGWGNNELQYYRPENTVFSAGNLIIEAKKESFWWSCLYTSSRLITKGKKEFKFGRIDIRAALPEGQGIWPALWMLGGNISTINWPLCGEIDIMELVGQSTQSGTWDRSLWHQQRSAPVRIGNSTALPGTAKFSDEFHVFSIVWEQDKIVWLLDDVQFYQITRRRKYPPSPYPFNQDFLLHFQCRRGWSTGRATPIAVPTSHNA